MDGRCSDAMIGRLGFAANLMNMAVRSSTHARNHCLFVAGKIARARTGERTKQNNVLRACGARMRSLKRACTCTQMNSLTHTRAHRTHTHTHTHARALSISLSLFSKSSSKTYVVLTPIVSHAYPNDAERLYRVSHFVVTLQCYKGIHHYPTISLWQVYAAALEVDCRRLARDGSSGSGRVYILSVRFVPIHQP